MKSPKKFFDLSKVDVYTFDNIPLDEELWLMDEQWLEEFAPAINTNDGVFDVGYHAKAIAKSIGADTVELSWIQNLTRFHEIKVLLPRDQFIICVDRAEYGVRPRVFVKGAWLTNLHIRSHSVFAMFDAIGVKKAITSGSLDKSKLVALRDRLDKVAEDFPGIALVSFADSLLVKTDFHIGQYDNPVPYSYDPELFIRLFPSIQAVYLDTLGLGVYAILTQGTNEYYDEPLISISDSNRHISLNSLGLPFAQLLAIEQTVRKNLAEKVHGYQDLYLDRCYYNSLDFDITRFNKNLREKYEYPSPMDSAQNFYYAESLSTISQALETPQ